MRCRAGRWPRLPQREGSRLTAIDYSHAVLPVGRLAGAAHNNALYAVAAPGAWWSGSDRLAIVREARAALACSLCQTRAGSLSAIAVSGEHDSGNDLPPAAIEAIHGIRNHSGRLTRRWFDHVIAKGMRPEAYVELVAVVASAVIVDTYAQGVGLDLPNLPQAQTGAPTSESSTDVVDAGAWVPIARVGSANILRSLALVPSALDLFFGAFGNSYYMAPNARFALARPQVELIAARVSAVNECFY